MRPWRLLGTAEAGPPDQLRRARADRLRGQIAFSSSRGSDAPPLLLKAARQFEPLDSRLARETYLDALAAATFAGRLALGGGMREVAEAARPAPPPPGPARGPDLLLDGLSLADLRGLPGGGAGAPPGGERLPRDGCLQGRGAALALAGLPRRADYVGLRQL